MADASLSELAGTILHREARDWSISCVFPDPEIWWTGE